MIRFENFSFTYKGQSIPTLKNINLTINDGEKIFIIGPSGSGKSTLGNCINGLIPHTLPGKIEGSCIINDLNLEKSSIYDISKKVGTVLQDSDAQFVGLTVADDIAFALENQNTTNKKMDTIVSEMAKDVNMEKFLFHSPQLLSGGQKQRVSLAGVLVDDVDILLFDEPLANLDPKTGEKAITIIDDIHKETNKTVVIIEHRLEDVLLKPIDKIVLIDQGEIKFFGTPKDLLLSDTLARFGIREPLYLDALKKANCDLSNQDLSNLDSINIKDSYEKFSTWVNANSKNPKEISGKNILSLKDISYNYDGKKNVLNNISFDVKEGEMLSILGKNGAGKSTLASIIMGIYSPDSGSIEVDGEDAINDTILSRSNKVGYVMQNPNHMISNNLIYDEIAFGLRKRGIGEKEVKKRVLDALELCKLKKYRKWPISALSYGQKKRVSIASILVMRPKILILDEPTAGQDYKRYKLMMEFLKELNEKTNITIIFVTHDMHLALEYTPRAIVLADGQLIDDDRVSNIFSNEEILEKANLKQTSLYELAKKYEIEDIPKFIEGFIQEDNTEKVETKFEDYKSIPDIEIKNSKKQKKKKKSQKSSAFGVGLTYMGVKSFPDSLNGVSKFIFFISWIFMILSTLDIRILFLSFISSLIIMKLTNVSFKRFKPFFIAMCFFVVVNLLLIFLFSPKQGVMLIGSETLLFGTGSYAITLETLWYLASVGLKYLSILPIALSFVVCTQPSEFASSLNKLHISKNISYSVSLTLRYLPQIISDYKHISSSQQSRGVDISNNAAFMTRVKNLGGVFAPLVLTSLDKITIISNAMILRGFGKANTRTWYYSSKLKLRDFIVIFLILFAFGYSLYSRFYLNITIFYPF
ncbi:MAG: DUF3744 domain-containing protein [Pleomorphochaeta sp.]